MNRFLIMLTLAVLSAIAVEARSSVVAGEYEIYDSQDVIAVEPHTDCNQEGASDYVDFICEGTVWEGASIYEPDKPYNEQVQIGRQWIEGSEVVNSREYMVVWKESKGILGTFTGKSAYIRKSGDKIYAIVPERLDIGEFLLYDFSLAPGEFVITMPYGGGQGFPYLDTFHFYCDGIELINSEGMDFESMLVNVENPRDGNSGSRIRWIKGIGSECGLLRNYNGSRFRIFKVYHNGELVYSVPDPYSLSIDGVIEDNCNQGDSKTYDLNGREVREGSKGLFIRNGKKIIVR